MQEDNSQLIEKLRRFHTIGHLLRSPLYGETKPFLDRLFSEPRVFDFPGCRPRLQSFLRIVQWNIHYGSRLEAISDALNQHPILRLADVLLMNEVDDGMSRSGNVSVTRELSLRLEANAVFGVEYLELGDPPGPPQYVGHVRKTNFAESSKSRAFLHGCAIFSRRPFSNARAARLHRCEDNFASAEKRIGGRAAVIIDLDLPGGMVTVGGAHLDVVNTPGCRRSQMRSLLEAIDQGYPERHGRALVGGDFNTHTFSNGGRLRALRNLIRILTANEKAMKRTLLNPFDREPLLAELISAGFRIDGFNDAQATNEIRAAELASSAHLPVAVRKAALNRLGSHDATLQFRLDWIASRGLDALSEGDVIDTATGVPSINPCTIRGLTDGGLPLSDHDPIVVDVRI
ncbi:MAG TPA: endonuclease/exonuclease/phosphatase family protein [Blastocatellia bacterium]|nr:endonuclease/exonuclease/phosphatase family protein [Blastocatellia bacterium]